MKTLAILGPAGTYSDKAAKLLDADYEIKYYPNILEVIHHLEQDKNALVPFENSLDGFVMESLDGMIKEKAYIHHQIKLDVDFSFVSFEKSIEEVKEVYVQFKAYGQCQDFILKHHFIPVITQSNMESLAQIRKKDKRHMAAILPSHTDPSEFPTIFPHIIGNIKDETRFVLISKEAPHLPNDEELTCSVVITPASDKPGVLYSILKSFNDNGINLNAILSRPRKDGMGKYIFYMEFILKRKHIEALATIKKEIEEKQAASFQILGYYNSL